MSWLLDFEEYSLSNAPPLRVSIYCNHVLQNHYPGAPSSSFWGRAAGVAGGPGSRTGVGRWR